MLVYAKILVSGLVQGVNYRRFAEFHARKLGLLGYVRNLDDGSVEILCQGERAAIDEFIGECRKGPPASRVEKLEATFSDAVEGFEGKYGSSFIVE